MKSRSFGGPRGRTLYVTRGMMERNDVNAGRPRQVILWVLAVVLTLSTAYYQRRTGPTRPLRVA